MISNEQKQRLIDTIALLGVPGVGKGRYWRLLERFGTPGAALAASVSALEKVPGISRTIASAVKEAADRAAAEQAVERIERLGWNVLCAGEPGYPDRLRPLPDAPPVLYHRGEPIPADDAMIAIVGTRRASESGRRFAYTLAADLARSGLTVVSGMAEGIDSAAHLGAIEAGGRTVAVWGTPLDLVYPVSNRTLAEQIVAHGATLSEYLPGTKPEPAYFPERNRIISGLSEGVVVVEAGDKSGALITAELAIQQGRELFAVPGGPDAARSVGANRLIKQGARMLTSAEDVFDELPRLRGNVAARKFKQRPDVTDTEQEIVALLSDGPLQLDVLARAAGLSVSQLMEVLLALEVKGIVQELSGKRFVLAEGQA